MAAYNLFTCNVFGYEYKMIALSIRIEKLKIIQNKVNDCCSNSDKNNAMRQAFAFPQICF